MQIEGDECNTKRDTPYPHLSDPKTRAMPWVDWVLAVPHRRSTRCCLLLTLCGLALWLLLPEILPYTPNPVLNPRSMKGTRNRKKNTWTNLSLSPFNKFCTGVPVVFATTLKISFDTTLTWSIANSNSLSLFAWYPCAGSWYCRSGMVENHRHEVSLNWPHHCAMSNWCMASSSLHLMSLILSSQALSTQNLSQSCRLVLILVHSPVCQSLVKTTASSLFAFSSCLTVFLWFMLKVSLLLFKLFCSIWSVIIYRSRDPTCWTCSPAWDRGLRKLHAPNQWLCEVWTSQRYSVQSGLWLSMVGLKCRVQVQYWEELGCFRKIDHTPGLSSKGMSSTSVWKSGLMTRKRP